LNLLKYIIRRISFTLCLFTLIPAGCLYSQSRHSLIEYTTENGPSLNSVNDMHFDQQGFLWITTADGLQRFDGYRFQTFKHDPSDKKSIPQNSVSAMYEDQNGNLWITHSTGICFKPKGKNEFINITSFLPALSFRYPLTCVNETDSTLWILNYPSGVYAVNKTTLLVKKVYDLPGFSDPVLIYPISRMYTKGEKVWFKKRLDKAGDLFQFSDNGLKQFSNKEKIKIFFLIPEQKDSLVIISDKWMYKASANDPFTQFKIPSKGFDFTIFDNKIFFHLKKIIYDQMVIFFGKKENSDRNKLTREGWVCRLLDRDDLYCPVLPTIFAKPDPNVILSRRNLLFAFLPVKKHSHRLLVLSILLVQKIYRPFLHK